MLRGKEDMEMRKLPTNPKAYNLVRNSGMESRNKTT